MLLFFLVSTTLFFLIYKWILDWRRKARLVSSLPMLSGAKPIIGHLLKMMFLDTADIYNLFQDISAETNKVGGVTYAWIGSGLIIWVTDPEEAYRLSNLCLSKSYVYKFASGWLGSGLVTSDLPTWKRHRKLLNPAFNQHTLDGFIPIFDRHSAKFAASLKDKVGKEFDHQEPLTKMFLEVISQTALGLSEDHSKLIDIHYIEAMSDILKIISERVLNFWQHMDLLYWLSGIRRKEEKAVKVLKENSTRALKKRKEMKDDDKIDRNGSGYHFKALLDQLLEQDGASELTEQEIREETDTIIAAGHDTMANTLSFGLMRVGYHLEVQDKIHAELDEVFGKSNRPVTKEDLNRMTYLDAVVKEMLRFYPVATVTMREINQDTRIRDAIIPAGSTVVLSLLGITRNPVWGADAELFRPERWLEPDSMPKSSSAFASFSLGKRNCIGRVYAVMNMKTTMANLLRRYRIKADVTRLVFKLDTMLKPKSGQHIILEDR